MPYLKFVVVVDFHSTASVCGREGGDKGGWRREAIKSQGMTDNFIYLLVQKN
jgi:hypothetical protein